ncbi:acetylornithine aminotransferase [Anaerosolibacter carboniphilus]|uniref:Acetylornithine aminotransferase n=1 Tax=Anaerosolibacter carboniphilus TaxID=1417629 RepID=A0A841KKT5_9FIRM|nr:aspartate aminotransferase family protein [Anaerosolibacter carboniphilus]MBB6214474.1 acetylornithine aminotransferase [Anaerosolibacter carboniphilus]
MSNKKLEHILNCHPMMKADITKGENTYLFDSFGKKIIDFEAGIWCAALGHSHPRVNAAMIEQINKIVHLHHKLTSDIAEALAVNLLELFHFQDGRAVFLSSGSEAVELSIRLSRLILPNKKNLTFSTSYLSAFFNSGIPRNKEQWVEIDFLQCSNCPNTECTIECNLLNRIEFSNISAFILEPAMCGRVLFPPYKLVKCLEKEVKNHGGMIVANEVTTGFGRTGKWFGYNHYDVAPDIIALGKSLGNGYPISAVVMSHDVAYQVEIKNFIYAQSHQNDPLGCATANEVLNVFKEDQIIDRSIRVGEFFKDYLLEIQQTCPVVKDVRGRGLMLAVELSIENAAEWIAEKMLKKGYFIGIVPQANVLRFSPALTITKHDIISMCKDLKSLLNELKV